jgi:hypothetical protein
MFIRLLPQGKYWSADFFRRLGEGIGKELARVHSKSEEVTKEASPHSCTELSIADWETFFLGETNPGLLPEQRIQKIKNARTNGKSNKFGRYLDIILSALRPHDPDVTTLARMNRSYIITIVIRTHLTRGVVIDLVHPEIKKIMRISGGIQYIIRP